MADPFTRFSWWLLGGKEREPAQNGSSLNSSLDWGFDWGFSLREPDCAKFPSVRGANKIASSSRKVRRKWQSREERRIDKEYDVVLVPSDGVCLSGSESDDSDWSIGWSEPHGPDFHSDNESENSFAVLVPCYRPGCKEVAEGSNNQLLSAIKNLQNEFSPATSSFHALKCILVGIFQTLHFLKCILRRQELYGSLAFFSSELLRSKTSQCLGMV